MATALSILALHDGGAEVSTNQINALLEATNNQVEAFLPIIFGNFFNTPEKIEKLIAFPAVGSGGGGGGGGGAAAASEDAKEGAYGCGNVCMQRASETDSI